MTDTDALDEILDKYIVTEESWPESIKSAKANLLKWRDDAVVAELKNIPIFNVEYTNSNGNTPTEYVKKRVKQLEAE